MSKRKRENGTKGNKSNLINVSDQDEAEEVNQRESDLDDNPVEEPDGIDLEENMEK